MSPELIGEQTVTLKSDIWSMGVLCWVIFNLGQIPFENKSLPVSMLSCKTKSFSQTIQCIQTITEKRSLSKVIP